MTADNVTIDGGGHALVGNGSGTAVTAAGVDEFTLTNVTLVDWAAGVSLRDVSDARVSEIAVENASAVGVAVEDDARDVRLAGSSIRNGSLGVRVRGDASDVTVAETAFADLTGVGVDLRGDEGRVLNSTFETTGGAAVHVRGDGALVANNSVRDTVGGIAVTDAAAVTVRANTLDEVQGPSIHVAGAGDVEMPRIRPSPGFHGVDVVLHPMLPAGMAGMADMAYGGGPDGVDDGGTTTRRYVDVTMLSPTPPDPVRVVDNVVRDSNGNGIVAANTSAVTVTANHVERSRDGVRIAGGSDATVANNTAVLNRDDGITIAASADATLRNNTVRNNTDDGLYVVGDGAVITGTLARDNGDDGVDVQNSTLAAVRGNRLVRNDDDGLYLRFVLNGSVEANVIRLNGDDGVDLRAVTGTVVANNSVCWNDHHELVRRDGTSNTTVTNSVC
ncbi:right-handed parallel beta-helix repeat-containing protein [Halolamina rubra]|uniref:right-handed parallel beta-helix repeat-containing protein n=1 Tax=Halolamina rubra TaxID=1380430 RepID=UPI000679526F|nr:right-handed parallel beta-helix repeat-containing protein [Halolamina rubra]